MHLKCHTNHAYEREWATELARTPARASMRGLRELSQLVGLRLSELPYDLLCRVPLPAHRPSPSHPWILPGLISGPGQDRRHPSRPPLGENRARSASTALHPVTPPARSTPSLRENRLTPSYSRSRAEPSPVQRFLVAALLSTTLPTRFWHAESVMRSVCDRSVFP